jgi:hypothetical protein
VVKTAIVLDVLIRVFEGVQVLQGQPFAVSGRQAAPMHKVLERFAPSVRSETPNSTMVRNARNLPSVRGVALPEGLGSCGERRSPLSMEIGFHLVHMKRVGA